MILVYIDTNLCRRAFSLLEIVVVVAILAVITGLTLPAIQKVRATAGITSCQNNLRQLSTASHSYYSRLEHFPYGVQLKFESKALGIKDRDFGFGWPSQLLSDLDQEQLFHFAEEAYSKRVLNSLVEPHPEKYVVKVFICQSEGTELVTRGENVRAVTHYLGLAGTSFFRFDGLLHRGIAFRSSDCTDGLSATMLFGERPPGEFGGWFTTAGYGIPTYGQLLYAGRNEYWPQIQSKGLCKFDTSPLRQGASGDNCDTGHFWSLHSGGANFAFADGSVKFLAYSANPIMPALATRAGGEVVELP